MRRKLSIATACCLLSLATPAAAGTSYTYSGNIMTGTVTFGFDTTGFTGNTLDVAGSKLITPDGLFACTSYPVSVCGTFSGSAFLSVGFTGMSLVDGTITNWNSISTGSCSVANVSNTVNFQCGFRTSPDLTEITQICGSCGFPNGRPLQMFGGGVWAPVPGPIVGAGVPSLIMGLGGLSLSGWWRRRQKQG